MNFFQCYTCDTKFQSKYHLSLTFIVNQQFVLYECYECKNKTAYCQLCSKIIGKLFNDIFFKCAKCNIISRTVSKEIVTSTNIPNPFPIYNTPPVSKDYEKIFSHSIMGNESIAKNLFGNADLTYK